MSYENSAAPRRGGAGDTHTPIIPPGTEDNTPDKAAKDTAADAETTPPGLAAGHRAIEAGLRAFPLRDKRAGLKDWANTAACDRDALAAMWPKGQAGKDALCAAVMPPGFVAIDIDASGPSHPDIPDGNENKALAWLEALTGEEPATWTTLTPSGGLHLVYRLREPLAKASVSGLLPVLPWKHVDIKAGRWKDETDKDTGEARKRLSAGYVVAAGSPGYFDRTPEGVTAPALAPEVLELFLHAAIEARARHDEKPFANGLRQAINDGTQSAYLADYLHAKRPTASADSGAQAGTLARAQRPASGLGTATPDGASRGRAYALAALRGEAAELAATGEGGRNDCLNKSAFKLGRFGARGWIDEAEAREALHEACVANGYIASDGEAAFSATFASGWGKGASEPATLPEDSAATFAPVTVSAHALDAPRSDEATPVGLVDGLNVGRLWKARPWLAKVYIRARASQLSPFSVLFSVLARVSAAVPFHVVAENPEAPHEPAGYAPLSVYAAIVGPAGSGKGAAGRLAAALVPDLRGASTTQPASGEGLVALYVRRAPNEGKDGKPAKGTYLECVNTAALLDVPEIRHLGGVADRRGSTVVPALASAWSGEALGAHNKAEADRLAVPRLAYRLALITGVQRGNASVLLREAETGLPQRFVWADTVDMTAPDTPPEPTGEDMEPVDLSKVPPALSPEARRAIYANTTGAIHPGAETFPLKVVTFPDEVRAQARKAGLARLRGAATGHTFQTRCRLAALIAVMEGRLEATMEDWELAGIMLAYSERVRRAAIEGQRDADAEAQAARTDTRNAANLASAQGCMLRWMSRNPMGEPPTGSTIIRKGAGAWGSTKHEGLADRALADAAERGYIECVDPVLATADTENGEEGELDIRKSRWTLTDKGRKKYPPLK